MADRAGVLDGTNGGAGQRSAGEIIREVVGDLESMVRSEIRLARAEMSEKIQKAESAAGLMGGAAVCGLLAGGCFVTACICALALAMPVGVAALLMGVFLICIAAALFLGGRIRLRNVNPVPERTLETIKETMREPLAR
jgi:hypothetical protein